ncbi:MAG: hypothetical protein FWD15_04965 [Alphaproteobacteria bacterium]|nr:hypothetical protein [Alphaproteobacteria bacterium]
MRLKIYASGIFALMMALAVDVVAQTLIPTRGSAADTRLRLGTGGSNPAAPVAAVRRQEAVVVDNPMIYAPVVGTVQTKRTITLPAGKVFSATEAVLGGGDVVLLSDLLSKVMTPAAFSAWQNDPEIIRVQNRTSGNSATFRDQNIQNRECASLVFLNKNTFVSEREWLAMTFEDIKADYLPAIKAGKIGCAGPTFLVAYNGLMKGGTTTDPIDATYVNAVEAISVRIAEPHDTDITAVHPNAREMKQKLDGLSRMFGALANPLNTVLLDSGKCNEIKMDEAKGIRNALIGATVLGGAGAAVGATGTIVGATGR